jgi:Mg2+-importing ATPase
MKQLKEAIVNPFNVVFIVVAVITLVTDVLLSPTPDFSTFIMLLIIVAISSFISFREQAKSDEAAQKLKNMITNQLDVIRDGVEYTVDVEDIVPGDLVKLSSGDMIPGDVRFLETKDLFIDQASLTGESLPVEKFATFKGDTDITDLSNIGFMGTNIVSGSSKAMVISTGSDTYFGSMAKSLYSVNEKNSFEKGVDSISDLLIGFMLVMVPIIFIINLLTKGDFLSSLVFAISLFMIIWRTELILPRVYVLLSERVTDCLIGSCSMNAYKQSGGSFPLRML